MAIGKENFIGQILNREALTFNKQEKDELKQTVSELKSETEILNNKIQDLYSEKEKYRVLANKNKIRFNYHKCRLLANLTFGNLRQHYIDKKHRLKKDIDLIKK